MRSRSILGLVALAIGCGEGHSAVRPATAPPPDVVAAPRVAHASPVSEGAADAQPPIAASATPAAAMGAEPPRSTAPVGHLAAPNKLAHLFEALANLDDGHAHGDVHILQYGDSHTASDLGVAVFRKTLQGRFGDGGRGFVSVGKPWKSYVQDGIRGGMTKEFEPTRVWYLKDTKSFRGIDGSFGLLGVGIASAKGGGRAWTDVLARSSRIELDYAKDPAGGSFDVLIDGTKAGRVATRAPVAGSGFFAFDVADAPHQIELHPVGDGEVRVFGMTLDRPEAGVVVDALGINGAQVYTPLRWNEAHFAEQLRHAAPDLVVVAYGTNEALEPALADAEYERRIVDFLGRIARATPTASCLLLGPPDLAQHTKGANGGADWRSLPRLAEIIAVQRKVAEAAGCAFYDQQEAMGGPGSIAAWASEHDQRAQGDHVHLTRRGYAEVATSFAGDLMHAYDEWRAVRGLPPTSAPPTPPPQTWGAR
ncbi:MAG: GDSL-type esterase/lipase family protein [Polyangiaceae bacterium]